MATNGSNTLANELMTSLNSGVSFAIPTVVLTGTDYTLPDDTLTEPVALTNDDLTTAVVDGTGVFDTLMTALNAHLTKEYEAGRISGDQYAKAYIELTTAAMGNAVQFLLSRDQAYWTAVQTKFQARIAQIGATTAAVELETAKTQRQLVAYQAVTQEAEYALTKVKLANEDITYAINNYKFTQMMPQEKALLTAQTTVATNQASQITAETAGITYKTTYLMPAELSQLGAQTTLTTNQGLLVAAQEDIEVYRLASILPKEGTILTNQASQITAGTAKITEETAGAAYQRTDIMPVQKTLLTNQASVASAQITLTTEQAETARAQTMDTRSNGVTTVVGVIGKQKELLTQQKTSYQRDAEIKGAKMFLDAFVAQKTVDEATTVPTALNSTNISTVFTSLKTNLSL